MSIKRLQNDAQVFKHSKLILDIGCGRGIFLKELKDRAIGIDGSIDNINYCKKKGFNVHHINLPGKLPFDNEYFNGIYCSHLIEHFMPNDLYFLFSEIDRILAIKGILLVRSPLLTKAFFDDPTHIRPYHAHCVYHFLGGWETIVVPKIWTLC